MNKRKIFFVTIIIILLATVGGIFYFIWLPQYQDKKARENDVAVVSGESFQQLLVSNFDTNLLDAYPLEYFRGYATYKAEYRFKDNFDLADYLNTVLAVNQDVLEVYTFVAVETEEDKATEDSTGKITLQDVVQAYPYVTFRFMLPGYSLDYLKAQEIAVADAYYEQLLGFYENLAPYSNVVFYYFGDVDWLISNPANYVDGMICNRDVNTHLMTQTLASDDYMVDEDGLDPLLEKVQKRVTREKITPPDSYPMPDTAIVFMGDSILGNFKGSLSIPGFVGGLSGANTYNFAVGGTTASSETADTEEGFHQMLSYFLNGEGMIEHENANAEIERFKKEYRKNQKLCFVIGFGLNDYFTGRVVATTPDADITTFYGALKSGILRIKEVYPNAEFVLLTPPYVLSFEYGSLIQSDVGGNLLAYVETVAAVAEDLEVIWIDQFYGLDIYKDNVLDYLLDDCHYNEKGRILMARNMLPYLYDLLAEK